ncbi:MAG TPA: hypothetical protein VGN20_24220 [Mucilaginibacter sp.]|jgi:hypothetical protein
MKRLIFSIAIAVIIIRNASAQNTASQTMAADTVTNLKNAWYIEVAGASLIGVTFNYERFLSKKPGGLSVHAGFGGGVFTLFDDGFVFGAVPAGISYNIPTSADKRQMIEIGGDYSLIFAEGDQSSFLSGIVSWRYETPSHNLIIRLTLMPIIRPIGEEDSGGPWFGFSIGRRF